MFETPVDALTNAITMARLDDDSGMELLTQASIMINETQD